MKKMAVLAMVAAVVLGGAAARAQEAPKMPAPQKEHEWLKQLEGDWDIEGEGVMEPGKPPVKSKGTESVRSLGGFWTVTEMKMECMGVPMTGVMTVGYDAGKKKYVGTWVCSMCDWLCKYEGWVDGKVLTLECEGPHPTTGKTVKMRDVIEVKDKDLNTLTSLILGDDGKWTTFMTMTAKRKK
jgi:hypothetical protein